MAGLLRRLSRSSERRRSAPACAGGGGSDYNAIPRCPPSPTLDHLTQDEIKVLNSVFCRLERFEQEEASQISKLQRELIQMEEHVRMETTRRDSLRQVDLRLCRLCFKTKFADGIGRACAECHKRVCAMCGSFMRATWSPKKNRYVKGKWRCLLCRKRRELACASGVWYNGGQAQPLLTADTYRRKVSDVGISSDVGCSADIEQSDSSHYHGNGLKTDTEIIRIPDSPREEYQKGLGRRLARRRLTSTSTDETADMADDEDLEVDDEQFLLERQRCRQERLQLQHKKGRKRQGRRSTVGTCTREDGIVPDLNLLCPRHGVPLPVGPAGGGEGLVSPKTAGYSSLGVPGQGVWLPGLRHSGPPLGLTPCGLSPPGNSTPASPGDPKEAKQRRVLAWYGGDNPRAGPSPDSPRAEKEKSLIHPRIRELTSHRKLSAPVRGYSDDRGAGGMLSDGEGRAARHRSGSVPVERRFRRSSSDGERFNFNWSGRRSGGGGGGHGGGGDRARDVFDGQLPPDLLLAAFPTGDLPDGYQLEQLMINSPFTFHRRDLPADPPRRWRESRGGDTRASSGSVGVGLGVGGRSEEGSSGRLGSVVTSPGFQPKVSPSVVTSEASDYLSATSSMNQYQQQHTYGSHHTQQQQQQQPHHHGHHHRHHQQHSHHSSHSHQSHHQHHSGAPLAGASRHCASLESVQKLGELKLLRVPSRHPLDPGSAGSTNDTGSKRGSQCSQEDMGLRRTSDTPSVATLDADGLPGKRNQLRRSSSCYRFRVVLQKDPKDKSRRTMGLGMRVVGGKQGPDGKLGAFVTWLVKGGPADMSGVSKGDQVLEWNGQSLVDATFEECQKILASPGDTVQLIIMHSRADLEKRPSDCYKPPPTWRAKIQEEKKTKVQPAAEQSPKEKRLEMRSRGSAGDLIGSSRSEQTSSPGTRSLDFLSMLNPPETKEPSMVTDGRLITGRLLLRLWYETSRRRLQATLVRAQDLSPRPTTDKHPPQPFAKLTLRNGDTQVYKTDTVKNSCSPQWKKVIAAEDLFEDQVERMTLLVTVWDFYPSSHDVFLGEVLLDLGCADLSDQALWYPLEEHDENAGPLPPPTPKVKRPSTSSMGMEEELRSRHSWQSLPTLPATPAHDKLKELLTRKDGAAMVEDKPEIRSAAALPSPEEVITVRKGKKIGILKRRVSEVAMKVGAILIDKRYPPVEKVLEAALPPTNSGGRRHSLVAITPMNGRKDRRPSGQVMLGGLLSARSLSQSSQSSQACHLSTDEDEGVDSSLRPAPEGDDVTSMLGPGQVPPKPSLEKLVKGDIRLGFMITKGQLEVDVICVKGLALTPSRQLPDTYVKTYLVGGGKRLQRRKTKTARACTDPLYRQKLKYSACNVHGRYMQVLIKHKSAGFDRNQCLGEVVVKLDQLDLSSHTMGWYKLFKESAVDLGSSESLAWE